MDEFADYNQVMRELESGQPPLAEAGFLGARLHPDDAKLLLLPVPWEATTSYGGGTSQGPRTILSASHQLDLEDGAFGTPYRAGITFAPQSPDISALNQLAAEPASQVIHGFEQGISAPDQLHQVNEISAQVNHLVGESAEIALKQGKIVGLVGGDHSSPYGLIKTLTKFHPDGFGILHIDAHHDFRAAYEGFIWSHASIFYNVMERLPQISKIVQLGIRDYSRAEKAYAQALGKRGRCFYDAELFRQQASGVPFNQTVAEIIDELPTKVYISFDIDGLEPSLCPSTGTPVAGGLSYNQAAFLLEKLAESGRQVIGFDLCEVAPGENGNDWDANVGARMLYKLCGCCLRSQGLC